MTSRIIKYYLIFLLMNTQSLNAQNGEIKFSNPSFEFFSYFENKTPRLHSWVDIEFQKSFPSKTTPLLCSPNTDDYNAKIDAHDGEFYIALETREDGTWGGIGSTLDEYLDSNYCYSFSIHLARSNTYQNEVFIKKNPQVEYFDTPIALAIWGITDSGEKDLLAVSTLVENTSWKKFDFKFHPTADILYLTFEAFPLSEESGFSNGHILLDDFKKISYTKCESTPLLKNQKNEKIKKWYKKNKVRNLFEIKKQIAGIEFHKNKLTNQSKMNIKSLKFIISQCENQQLIFDFNGLKSKHFKKRKTQLEEILLRNGFKENQFQIRNSKEEDDNIRWLLGNEHLFIGMLNKFYPIYFDCDF